MNYKIELMNIIFLSDFKKAYEYVDCLDDLVDDDVKSILAYGEYLRASKDKDIEKRENALLKLEEGKEKGNTIAMFFYGLFMSHDYDEKIALDILYDAVDEMTQNVRKTAIDYHLLGYFYHILEYDMKRAINYYTLSAKDGLYESLFLLAELYETGYDVKKSYKKAFYWHLEGTKYGLPSSFVDVGDCYENGKGVKKDLNEAIKWYEMGADLGYPMAYFNLGVCYYKGIGVEYNLDIAKDYFIKASEFDVPYAMHNLGNIYRMENNPLAIEWLEKSAALGIGESMMTLGSIYEDGELVSKDLERALSYYQEAKDLNIDDADDSILFLQDKIQLGSEQAEVNYCERHALKGNKRALLFMKSYYLDKNDNEAVLFWLKKAAEFNDRDSLYELGDIYLYGYYGVTDVDLALSYYEQAVKLKHGRSCYDLAQIYYSDEIVKKDCQKSIYYLDLAIKYGYIDAYYLKGLIVSKEFSDFDKAQVCYLKGAEKKQRDCLNQMGEFFEEKGNYAKALEFYLSSAKHKSNNGMYNAGRFYLKGLGVPKNKEKAVFYLKKASKNGHKKAKELISMLLSAESQTK